MKWKDSDGSEKPGDEMREEYFEEEYSPLKRPKFNFGFNVTALFVKPVFWGVAAACLFIILLLVLFSGGPSDSGLLNNYAARLEQLEKRIIFMEEITSRLSMLEKEAGNAQPLMVRLERLETSIAQKLNEMDEKINQMARRSTVSTQAAGKYHTVQKGDTLYGIGQQYGLTIEQLRKLNALHEGSPIQPGQRLLIK